MIGDTERETIMTDLEFAAAVDAVARRVVARVAMQALGGPAAVDWEDFPDIGEHDWLSVCERIGAVAAEVEPADAVFEAAYRQLAARADRSS